MHYTRESTSESEVIYHSELITDRLILCVLSVTVIVAESKNKFRTTFFTPAFPQQFAIFRLVNLRQYSNPPPLIRFWGFFQPPDYSNPLLLGTKEYSLPRHQLLLRKNTNSLYNRDSAFSNQLSNVLLLILKNHISYSRRAFFWDLKNGITYYKAHTLGSWGEITVGCGVWYP